MTPAGGIAVSWIDPSLALVAVIYAPSVGVRLYGEIGRLDRVVTCKQA